MLRNAADLNNRHLLSLGQVIDEAKDMAARTDTKREDWQRYSLNLASAFRNYALANANFIHQLAHFE